MKLFKATRLGLIAVVAVAGFTIAQGHTKNRLLTERQQIETKKDPKVIAAEQLAFVSCKKKGGKYKSYHGEDMKKVLSAHGIESSLLNTKEVKNLAQKYIDGGKCDMLESLGWDRIWDGVPKKGEGESQFKNLVGWEREVAAVMAEADRKRKLGEFNYQERDSYTNSKLKKIVFPNDMTQNELQTTIAKNIPSAFWLVRGKVNKKNCLWMPE